MDNNPRTASTQQEVSMTRNTQPAVIVFDVNETLSDLGPLEQRFAEVGAPEHLATLWFTSVLRDGFALAAAGSGQTFGDIAAALLRVMLPEPDLHRSLPDAVAYVMEGFGQLGVHPAVVEGVAALADAGMRVVTLGNGAAAVAERLLLNAGMADTFERFWSGGGGGVWKPAAAACRYALDQGGVQAQEAMMVAVPPWDVDGAHRAGLRTAWINREGGSYPAHLTPSDTVASSILSLAGQFRP